MTLQRYSQQYQLDANVRPVDPAVTTPRGGTAPGQQPIR